MPNPFGVALIIVIITTIIISRSSLQLFRNFLILEFIFSIFKLNYGYFFKLGGTEIQYGEIILALVFSSAALHLGVSKINRPTLFHSAVLVLVTITGIIGVWLVPADVSVIGFNNYGGWDGYLRGELTNMAPVTFSMQSLLMLARVCFFVIVLVAAKSVLTRKDWLQIFELLVLVAKVMIIFGLFEILIRFALNYDLNLLLNQIFGRGISTGGALTRLQGLSREPSHYALALFNMMILFMLRMKIRNKFGNEIIWLGLILLIGTLASTFSFFIAVLSALLLFSMINSTTAGKVHVGNLAIYSLGLLLAVAGFLFYSWSMSSGLMLRIIEAGVQAQNGLTGAYVIGEDYGSEASRIIGMIESFNSYLARPFFGLGLGTTYCVSGIISILSNVGLLGLIIWFRLLTVHYFPLSNFFLAVGLFLPITVTNDLGALYDTAYLALIPLLFIATGHYRVKVQSIIQE